VKLPTLLSILVLAGLVGGCAVAEQDASAVGEQFQQGLQGQGRIIHRDPLADSFGSDYN
jgi:hypothetical protein